MELEELTEEQEKKIPEYVEKWVSIGNSTDPCDREKAEHWVNESYKIAGLEPPKLFIWANDPIESTYQINFIEGKEKNDKDYDLKFAKEPQLELMNEFVDKCYKEKAKFYVPSFIYGCHDAHYFAFYEYATEVLNIDLSDKILPVLNVSHNCGWWSAYEHICFMQEKPEEVHVIEDHNTYMLHAELGPAIKYRGKRGARSYSLWDVEVPQWVAETPYEKLDLKKIMKIENIDVRALAFKRYGAERLASSEHAKVIEDKWDVDGYKLLDLHSLIGDSEYAPYLLMKNPSVKGLIHCEGLDPEVKTIDEAIKWSELRENEDYEKVIHT